LAAAALAAKACPVGILRLSGPPLLQALPLGQVLLLLLKLTGVCQRWQRGAAGAGVLQPRHLACQVILLLLPLVLVVLLVLLVHHHYNHPCSC
jgi:hypothetical protein